jgi:hypothetical protein
MTFFSCFLCFFKIRSHSISIGVKCQFLEPPSLHSDDLRFDVLLLEYVELQASALASSGIQQCVLHFQSRDSIESGQ